MQERKTQADFITDRKRFDPKQYLFERGVFTLMECGGLNERQARSWLGQCMKATKDNPYPVMEALQMAQDKAEMVSFMRQALLARGYVIDTRKRPKKPETVIENAFLKTLMQAPGMSHETVASWFGRADVTEDDDRILIEVETTFMAKRIKDHHWDAVMWAAHGKTVEVRAK